MAQQRYINAVANTEGIGLIGDPGDERLVIPFSCEDGKNRVFYSSFASDKAQEFTIKAMIVCGWLGEWDNFSTMTCTVSLVVVDEEYPVGSGQWKEKVKYVNQPGGVAVNSRMDEQQKKNFAARMRGMVAAVMRDTPQPARPTAPAKKPVPFNRVPSPTDGDAPPDFGD